MTESNMCHIARRPGELSNYIPSSYQLCHWFVKATLIVLNVITMVCQSGPVQESMRVSKGGPDFSVLLIFFDPVLCTANFTALVLRTLIFFGLYCVLLFLLGCTVFCRNLACTLVLQTFHFESISPNH